METPKQDSPKTPFAPFINRNADLVIPMDSNRKYHAWRDGQSIFETLRELGASEKITNRYVLDWKSKLYKERLNEKCNSTCEVIGL